MVAIPVNPKVLEWARTERRLSLSEAAERIGIGEDALQALETGAELPGVTLLRKMATKYEIALGSLLMPQPLPPATRPAVRDFRTHEGEAAQLDHQLIVELEDIDQQVTALAEIRDAAPEMFGPALPSATTSSAVRLASSERERIGIPVMEQLGWASPSHGFRRWRATVEARGVFVYLANLGDATNCRGFTIFDNRNVPVIVINSNEREAAPRTYTLFHEYAHLLLRQPGITNERGGGNVERFCNQFAAFFLMPPDVFSEEAKPLQPEDKEWEDWRITKLANRFKVSKAAVAIHLEETGLALPGLYHRMLGLWRARRKSKGGPVMTHEERRLNALGTQHVRVVFRALERGHINQLDAHELLGLRPEAFGTLRKEVSEYQAAYGGPR